MLHLNEYFLEQGGADHPAPRRKAGGAGTHDCGELLGEAVNDLNARKMVWESHILSGLVQQGERILKAVLKAVGPSSVELLLK